MQRIDNYIDNNIQLRLSPRESFNLFLNNPSLSSYTVNEECLKECIEKIPLKYMFSDEVYPMGAYRTGAIAGFKRDGSIVELPFARDSDAYNTQDLVVNTVSIDQPVIDNLYYNREWGLSIENARSSKIQATSGRGTGNQYNTTVNPTGMQITQLPIIREITGNTYVNQIGIPAQAGSGSMPYSNTGGTIIPTSIPSRYMRILFDVTDLPSNSRIVIYSAPTTPNNRVVFDKNGNLDASYTGVGSSVLRKDIFYKDGRQYLYIYLQSDDNSLFGPNPRVAIGRSPFSPNENSINSYVGDASVQVKYGWITYAQTIEELDVSFIWINRFNDNSALPIKGEDILTINLTQTSDIFFNTSKGVFEFKNQPAGVFDYKSQGIIDCKIHAICIKYVDRSEYWSDIYSLGGQVNEESLLECMTKVPMDWRNSSELYVAGAWKTGGLLGYKNDGSVCELPFNRDSESVGMVGEFKYLQVPVNTPSLCRFYGGTRDYGYYLFNQYNIAQSSNDSAINPWRIITENNGTSYTTSGYVTGISNFYNYEWIYYTQDFWLDVGDLLPTRYVEVTVHQNTGFAVRLRVYANNIYELFSDNWGGCELLNSINYNGRQLMQFRYRSRTTEGGSFRVIIKDVNGAFVGDSNSKLKIGWVNINIEGIDNKPYNSYLYLTDTLTNQRYRPEDILTLNLTQTADLMFNTSKGMFIFRSQPAGTFDYKANGIIDCKIYAIAINYI